MKIIAYLDAGRTALGVVTSPSHFIAAADVAPDLPADLICILERDDGLARLREATAGRSGDRLLADVTLKPFLSRPPVLGAYCVA